MKKIICMILSACLLCGCFWSGCNDKENEEGGAVNYVEKNDVIKSVTKVGSVTGSKSEWNDTVTGAGVAGTDLGIPVYDSKNQRMMLFFGDTFSEQIKGEGSGKGNWRSNVCAYSSDFDLSDGLTLDGWLTQGGRELARQVIPSMMTDGYEMTTIPTGAVEVNGALYVFYMSVRSWGANGEWWVSYCGTVKSTDGGETFVRVEDLTWTGIKDETTAQLTDMEPSEVKDRYAPNFCQIWPMAVGEYVYIYGIEGGRFGGVKLGRVKSADFENFSEYEYLTEIANGEPVFVKGEEGLKALESEENREKSLILQAPAGEMCVVYNRYLEKYITVYQQTNAMVFRSADNPWGAWSEPVKLVDYSDFNAMYCGFMHEKYMADGGKTVYFLMSYWWDYETILMKMELY